MRAPRSCPSPWWPTSSRRRSNCSTISRFSERSVPATDPHAAHHRRGRSMRVIGTSPARPDAWEKVRGRPIYAGDLALAGMLHGRIVRSPYASARIVRIDTNAAGALPGVAAVLTHADVPRNELRMELPGRMAEATAGAVLATQPVLAAGRIRFQGEPVVAIAAETPEIADRATELVEVDYEELPGVFDPLDALRPGAALVHGDGNVLRR